MHDRTKILVLFILVIAAAVMAVYFYYSSPPAFIPAQQVDQTTFSNTFSSSKNIVILMDVRGITDSHIRTNIFQCGIDFAGSPGMARKNTDYFSVSDDACVAVDGNHAPPYCFANLTDHITFYITSGNHTSYYSNGIIVGIGSNYRINSCYLSRT